MAAPSSLNSRMAFGVQSAKGTASTSLVAGYMRRSMLAPRFDYMEPIAEHYGGTSSRPTVRKSASDRPTYLMQFGGRQRLKPVILGHLLRGAGFGSATSGSSPAFTHAFTLADRQNHAWLSIMSMIGEGTTFERKAKDCRINQITIAANSEDVDLTFGGLGLSELTSAGSETVTTEPSVSLLRGTGSVSLTIGGVAVMSYIMGSTLNINNPLSEEEVALHTAAYADLPATGIDISGTLQGIEFDANLYKKLNWGGTSGTAPTNTIPTGVLTYSFESGAVIPTGAVPYSFTVSVPTVELKLSEPVSEDNNLVRCNVDWSMIDTGSTPITITLVNGKTNYTS